MYIHDTIGLKLIKKKTERRGGSNKPEDFVSANFIKAQQHNNKSYSLHQHSSHKITTYIQFQQHNIMIHLTPQYKKYLSPCFVTGIPQNQRCNKQCNNDFMKICSMTSCGQKMRQMENKQMDEQTNRNKNTIYIIK